MAPHIAIPIVVSAAAAIAAWLAHRSHGQPRRTPVRAFYLLDQADTDELPFLEKAAAIRHGVSLTWGTTLEEGPPASDVNVLVTRLPTAEALDKWTSLRWVIVPFAGPTEKTRQLLRERPRLSLHNAHFNAQSTSELAVGLLLAAAKRIVTRETTLRREAQAAEHAWTPGWMVTDGSAAVPTLGGRVALVLGYGAIGKRVAKALDGLGMEVHACRRSATHQHQDGVATVHGMGMLHQLLSTSFVLIVCVPGTADTEKLIGAAELAMMPSGSLLVNVGRGSVIDEHALYEALQRGHLGGAGIGRHMHVYICTCTWTCTRAVGASSRLFGCQSLRARRVALVTPCFSRRVVQVPDATWA